MCQLSDMFYSAVVTLAGHGKVKQRLVEAYADNLAQIAPEEMPDNIRPRFVGLRDALYAVEPFSREDPVQASVRKMSSRQAGEHAAAIVEMFGELVRVKSTGEKLRVVSSIDDPETCEQVPSYLKADNDEPVALDSA